MDKHIFNKRLIVLDTETTGLNPQEGHRIIEIGCVELINRRLTGNRFHVYINPERRVDDGAIAVHGITNEFLQDKSRFSDIVGDFIAFIKDAELIIHNAPFDVGFLNHEFTLLGDLNKTISDVCTVFDTLAFARKKHPGQRNTLDALCKRYDINNSHRDLHGALLDAEILADVFLTMTGGQASLLDENPAAAEQAHVKPEKKPLASERPALIVIPCNDLEFAAHQQRLAAIAKTAGTCLWNDDTGL